MEPAGLVLRASRHVLDPRVADAGRHELRANGGAKVDVRLVAPLGGDHARSVRGPRDLLGDVAPDLEAARPDARPDRGDETRAAAAETVSGEPVDSGPHDPGGDPAPARVDRRDVAGRLVSDENGHAVGHANPHGDDGSSRAADERVRARSGGRVGRVGRLDRVPAVHLFHLRDRRSRWQTQLERELGVGRDSFGKSVAKPGGLEEPRSQQRHGGDDASNRVVIPLDAVPMRPQDPFIGRDILNGSFRILQKIGSGGMGAVYKAMELQNSRMVGVKILHPKLANRKDLVSRFGREARALSQLSHPNTVRVFLYGELEDGALYIIMELLEGKNLNQTVRSEGPFPIGRALPILIQACGALDEAHKAGIIHRDLKPENIFLVQSGAVRDFPKLLDFGLAKVGERQMRPGSVILTQEGMVFGTPEFMSPEQAQGKTLAPASDVYSLAVILYEVLTGKLPFEAKSAMDFIQMHVTGKPIPLNQRVAGMSFPPLLEQVDGPRARQARTRTASRARRTSRSRCRRCYRARPALPPGAFASSAQPLPVTAPTPPLGHAPAYAHAPATAPAPSPAAPYGAAVLAANPHRAMGLAAPQRKINIPLLVAVGIGFLLIGVGLAVSLMKLAGR